MKILIIFSTLLIGTFSERTRFDHYKVHRLIPKNEEQVRAIEQLQKDNEFNFWAESGSIGRPVDIMVPPHKRSKFSEFLERNGMQQQLFIENVQKLIDEEQSVISTRANKMDWDNYHSLDEIYEWLGNLTKAYKNVKKIVVGKTYEKRDIFGIEITFGAQFRTVFIESGIHAREWIAAASTSWVVNEILQSPPNSIWRKFNYIYVPFYNPDGYAYSWTNNRLWRKTRTPYKSGSGVCYGADPNRYWPFHWKEAGTSNDPCSEIYCGPQPFSEMEMKAISEFLTANAKNKKIDLYLDFHSYSQLIMYPWDYTSAPASLSKFWVNEIRTFQVYKISNYNEGVVLRFQRIGEASAADLKAVNNETFLVGGGGSLLYATGGTSLDWFYSKFNSTITYLWELRDKGRYGFLLPPKYILPSGKELYASIQRILIEYDKLPPKNFD